MHKLLRVVNIEKFAYITFRKKTIFGRYYSEKHLIFLKTSVMFYIEKIRKLSQTTKIKQTFSQIYRKAVKVYVYKIFLHWKFWVSNVSQNSLKIVFISDINKKFCYKASWLFAIPFIPQELPSHCPHVQWHDQI